MLTCSNTLSDSTDTGDVYAWGSNEFGQLGCPSLNLERSRNLNDPLLSSEACVNLSALPVPVDLPEDVSVVAVRTTLLGDSRPT